MSASRRVGGRIPRVAGLLAVTLAVAAVTVLGAMGSPGSAEPPPAGITLTAAPTTNLVDGTKVSITLRAAPDVVVSQMIVKQCRLGVTYEASDDLEFYNGKCPASPVSSSADAAVIRDQEGFFVLSRQPEGLTVSYRVGAGTAQWQVPGVGSRELTCGPGEPCALVVRLRIAGKAYFWTTRLDFVESDPIAACGGASPDLVASAGADEMSDAWATWTRRFCSTRAGGGAPTSASFGGGEGPAVSGFSSGLNDIAYTAAGFNPKVGFNPPGAAERPAVAVPVALNAAVMATGSGRLQTVDGLPIGKTQYPTLELTAAETAALVSGGVFWAERADQPYRGGILGRNPELDNLFYYSGGAVDTAGVYAQSLPLASVYFLTEYLATNAPEHFAVPGGEPRVRRSATANFALASPPYSEQLRLVSGRPSLRRFTESAMLNQTVPGPIWTVTDLANAKALELGLIAIETTPGTFVEPNAETMQAAVATMKRDERGLLLPDPASAKNAVAGAATAAYPLTYVVYALVPAEPLYDENCQPRSAAQALLTDWLTFITTDGQRELPAGLVALTDELRSEAKAQIAKVGSAPVTGACAAPAPPAAAPPAGSTGAASLPGSALPSGASRLPAAPVPPVGGPGAASANAAASTGAAETLVAVPVFAGRAVVDATGGVVALVGIALVTSLGLFLTARAVSGDGALQGEGGYVGPLDQRRSLGLAALWLGIAVAGVGLVVYQLGPMLQQRDQRTLFAEYRDDLRAAAFATQGLDRGVDRAATKPPEIGDPVGILEINGIQLQEVVVEGIGADETAGAPGHVPGTAGIGQPGNSVVVGRRNAFGGPFARLDELPRGSRIVAVTTQGESVYEVVDVERRPLTRGVFSPSADDRLTLVTSASSSPFEADDALVVTAVMEAMPFEPTVQGALTDEQSSVDQSGSWSRVALALVLYGAVLGLALFAYRRFRFPIAYILTIAPIVAVTVVLAESVAHLLPSWV